MKLRLTTFVALFFVLGCNHSTQIPLQQSQEKTLPPVSATASVDRALISTEDSTTFSVLVNKEKTIEVNLPDIGSRISGFRIVDFGTDEKDEDENRKSIRKWFSLRADVSGSYVLPEVEISYSLEGQPKTVKTAEIFVEVKPPNTETTPTGEDLRDIKDLERTPTNFLAWGLVILGIAGVAVGIFLWKIRKKSQPEVPELSPHELALKRLEEIPLPDGGDPTQLKRFYFELSEIVRFYVEGRYAFRATDMTNEEIVQNLKNNSSLPESEKPAFIELLKEADIVKFTDFHPPLEATWSAKERAKRFVFTTKPEDLNQETESVV